MPAPVVETKRVATAEEVAQYQRQGGFDVTKAVPVTPPEEVW